MKPAARHIVPLVALLLLGSAAPAAAARGRAKPQARAAAGLVAAALDNAHVRLRWRPVTGAVRYNVSRGGLLVGTVVEPSFTDALLWPATRYRYTVEAIASAGSVISTRSVSATTKLLPREGFQRPFAASSPWNRPVGNSRVHPESARFAAYLARNALYPNVALHRYGVSVAEARPSDPLYRVPCTRYACTLDAFGAFPIPLTAKPDPSRDGHLAVYDPASKREWGMWQAKPGAGSWSASAGAAVSLAGDGIAPRGTQSGNAANFPLLGGLLRPEEILQGRIDHALVFGIPGVSRRGHVCPATHNDGSSADPYALREGMRLQLDPAVAVDSLPIPSWQKTIARALQEYGMYLRDESGSLAIWAESPASRGYDAWASVGLGGVASAPLAGIPWDRFRVIEPPC